MAEKEEKKVEVKQAEVVEVPTNHVTAFRLENGDVVDTNELLVRIYNDVQKIKKSVA